MTTRIFLSYAHSDRGRVLGLKELLELGGATVFVDWRSIAPGADWKRALESALGTCDVLCVFWTRAARKSKWVEREYTTFIEQHPSKPCVPLCADDEALPASLADRQELPGFLRFSNELLVLSRRLADAGVSRSERERLVRQRLMARGVELGDERQKLLVLFALGTTGFSLLALLTSLWSRSAVRIGLATVFVAGGSAVLVVHCRSDAPLIADATRRAAQASTLAQKERSTNPMAPDPPASVPPPAPSAPDVDEPQPTAEQQICRHQPSPDAKERPIEDPGVVLERSVCRYLDAALRASERDFMDLITGRGRVTAPDGNEAEVSFPLCRKTGESFPNLVRFETTLRHPNLIDCAIVRHMSSDSQVTGGPGSMFQTCMRQLAPEPDALSAFDELVGEVAQCLRVDRGWIQDATDRPSVDANGALVLHTDSNGIARTYFNRFGGGRRWSVSVVLGTDEHIALTQAATGQRARIAQLELQVALSSKLTFAGSSSMW